MNPTATSQSRSNSNPASLFEKAFDSQSEFEQPEVLDTLVAHTAQDKEAIKNSWSEFYSLKTEDITSMTSERPISRIEIEQTTIETQFSQPLRIFTEEQEKPDRKPIFVIENQKGSGSIFEETGIKLDFPGLLKESKKTIVGVFSLFKEIFMDTVTLVVGKKDKKTEKIDSDPAKARAAAEKKAEKQKKSANIRAFYEGLRAQAGPAVSIEAIQMDVQEKENINKTIKLTNASYKGIKNSFGRLTVYAASMFEREQLDQEKQVKKVEKEQKMNSVKGPDLNLDKAAEGGFLSSTGGQGAG